MEVVTGTGVSIGETSNQGSGENSKRRFKPAQIAAHSVSEKRRRKKFKEKIKTLQELLPDSDKTHTTSVLDTAVKHIQLLKLQTQGVDIQCSSLMGFLRGMGILQ